MDNPYQAALAPQSPTRPDDASGEVLFREFRAGVFHLWFSRRTLLKKLRQQAVDFINLEVGSDNVVAITEHASFDNAVIVWYRGVAKVPDA